MDDTDDAAITSQEALRASYGEPLAIAVAIVKDHLDEHHRRFIEHSPFLCIASAASDGLPSVSPKGDAPGFVHVIDEHTLVIPDRPGNNKVETWENILDNPKVALIFFVPGIKETLRVHGTARLVGDDAMRELGRAADKLPRAALVVRVTQAFIHCGKSVVRSKLWDSARHVEAGVIPSFGQMVKDQAQHDGSAEEIQTAIDKSYGDDRLY